MSQQFFVEQFTPVAKNTLVGFVTVRSPRGLVFHDVAVHRRGDSVWASPASKPLVGRDGVQLKDAAGKTRWTPVVSFAAKELRDRWSAGVIAAVQFAHPEVFG